MDQLSADDILARIAGLSPDKQAEIKASAIAATKDKVFIPQPGPQTAAYFSKADILLFGGSPGGGKLLDSSTYVPVPTETDPNGFKLHGELEPGDFVYGKNGERVKVLIRHPFVDDAKSYELTFSTGEKVIACADHLWEAYSRHERLSKNPTPSVRTTQAMFADQRIGIDNRANYAVAIIKPTDNVEAVLPWNPYLFGLWLGDGITRSSRVIMTAEDWAEIGNSIPTTAYEKAECKAKKLLLLRRFCELDGVQHLPGGKHIPPAYLRASYAQRLELLRGMMDTDGTCDARGHCEIGFSNRRLAMNTLDLLNSLGIKAAIRAKKMRSENHATHYRMKFIPEVPVFKLPRKLVKQKMPTRGTTDFRYIEKIEPCDPVRMNCLTVEGGLYAFGREHIITHNTALEVGLALNEHHRALIIRKNFVDLAGVLHTLDNILGQESSAIGGTRPVYRKPAGGVIDFMGLGDSIDGKQGNPHDLICVDEVAQVPEFQVRMLLGWMRTDRSGQRCRMVLGSNPPLDSTGDWLAEFFAPWLNPQHPNPAQEGELRYYLPNDEGGGDRECGPDDYTILNGVKVRPLSRTFISSKFTDNAYYNAEDYARALAGLPDEVRTRLSTGNFLSDRPDDVWQAIPTAWVRAAQDRWTPTPPPGVPQCAIGLDVAQGGADHTIAAQRYDGWFAKLVAKPGKETPDGKKAAGVVIALRRDNSKVIVDIGGGWGGDCYAHLRENGIDAVSYMGVKPSSRRTADNLLKFANVRSEAYWRFREALDASQPQGSPIFLPPDTELLADLCAPRYEIVKQGKDAVIKIEPKDEVKKRLGRSPDRGDAVVMAWWDGMKQCNVPEGWKNYGRGRTPQVVLGRSASTRTAPRR